MQPLFAMGWKCYSDQTAIAECDSKMATVSLWVIIIVLLAPFVGLLLLIERAWVFLTRRGASREADRSVGKGLRMVIAAIAVIVLVVLGTGLVMVIELAQFLFGGPSFTKSVKVTAPDRDRGYYYRLKASYTYKGEPLDFDIVVGCRVGITTYKDNSRTFEVGVAPTVYGLKMKDGRGVVVKPPEACEGETTENGEIPKTLLPLIVTYESAEAPWIGLAYVTEDAYESSISELKFFGATISRATREEWQEWRNTEAPKNFVTYELLGVNEKNIFDHVHWKPGYRAMGSVCTGFSWVRLPEPVREAIRPYWPSSKPNYWYRNVDMEDAFRKAGDFNGYQYQDPKPGLLFEGHRLYSYIGLPTSKPEVRFLSKDSAVGALYPAKSDLSFDRLDDSGELPAEIKAKSRKSYAEVNVDPQLKGFAYCDMVPYVGEVPSAVSVNQRLADRINGELINEALSGNGNISFDHAFERDEYVIFQRSYWLANIVFGGL
jgi:hypothetical protein